MSTVLLPLVTSSTYPFNASLATPPFRWIEGNRFLSPLSLLSLCARESWFACEFCRASLSKLFIKENRELEYGNQLGRIEIWFLDSLLMIRLLVCFDFFFFFFGIKFRFLIKLFRIEYLFCIFVFFLNIAEINWS